MVFLIEKGHNELHPPSWRSRLFLTMSCIQKAEPPKRRSLHKADTPCYGVFNIKGHDELVASTILEVSPFFDDELHTKGGTPKKAEPPQGGHGMLWCF